MISIQVDFAKHSECVSKKDFQDIKAKVTKYPDYLQKQSSGSNREIYESSHVLGQMYRDIDINEY